MATFGEANQAKLSLKMTLSEYFWYKGSAVISDGDDWCIVVHIEKIDNEIRKIIPNIHNGISVKVDSDSKPRNKM